MQFLLSLTKHPFRLEKKRTDIEDIAQTGKIIQLELEKLILQFSNVVRKQIS